MTLDFGSIPWLAVGIAALAIFFLGALWYTAFFGKAWQKLHGYSDEKVKQMQAAKPPPVFFGGMLASYLLVGIGLALVLGWAGAGGVQQGATVGLVLWLGLALPIGFTAWLASDKPLAAFAIDWSYQLAFLVMGGVIIASLAGRPAALPAATTPTPDPSPATAQAPATGPAPASNEAPMPQFIWRLVPARLEMVTKGPTPEEQQQLGAHFAYLQGLEAKGSLILAGKTSRDDETVFGVCIARAESEEAARALMQGDPAVQSGVMKAELFPFGVALGAGAPRR
jgi:uncharacterized protein YciI